VGRASPLAAGFDLSVSVVHFKTNSALFCTPLMRNVVSLPAGLHGLSVKFARCFAPKKSANKSAILPRFSGCHFLVQNLHQCHFLVPYFCPRGWTRILAFTIGNSRCKSRCSKRLSLGLSWPLGLNSLASPVSFCRFN
jgi:hypothetical protein